MKYFALPLLWALLIGILSLMPGPQLPEVNINFADKIAHLFVYLILVLLSIWAFGKKNKGNIIPYTTFLKIFASCSMYGILMEILQFTTTTNRNFEIPDIIANIVGCLFGVFLYKLIKNLSS